MAHELKTPRLTEPKITLVGAGGISFGPSMVNDVIRTPALTGSLLVLHDIDAGRLERAFGFASKMNAAAGSPVVIARTTDASAALDGAHFVISSAEIGRFEHWRQDYEIPNRHGARQISGENGGPGAVFHSLRSINTTLGICRDIEKWCPDTFLVNLSNPMSRVTLAINRATRIRNVGMCHEMPIGVHRIARLLGIDVSRIEARASGINHFTFFTEMRDRETGEDLLARTREMFDSKRFDFGPVTTSTAKLAWHLSPLAALAEQLYSPVVVAMARTHGVVACSVDSHIGEYLPWATSVGAYHPVPVDLFERLDRSVEKLATWVADTRIPLPLGRLKHSFEEVVPIIAAMWNDAPARVMAVNVVNHGHIPNIADGAIVEVGATVDGDGIHADAMDPIATPLDTLIATQLELQDLIVDSALTGDPAPAFEAVVRDPCAPADERACRAIFEELMALQADRLPFA